MKAFIQIGLLVFLTVPFFSFTNLTAPKIKDAKGPLITATVSTQLSCKTGNSCANWLFSTKRWHSFKITLTGSSITFYNSNFTYKIYAGTNPYAAGATPIATFPCTKNIVEFAGSQLLNNTTYSVLIATSGASGMVTFTTGTGAGTNCAQDGGAIKKRN